MALARSASGPGGLSINTSSANNLFGNSTSQAPPAGGLFGGNTTTTQPAAGGALFNNNAASTTPKPGGLFGNTTSTAPSQSQQSTGGIFGGASGGGGVFGSSTATQQPQQTAGGLFGNSTQSSQPASSGGLFGSVNTNQQQQAGGGLFASTVNNTAQQQQQQPQQQQTGGGLFGSQPINTNQQQQQQQTGGLFGNNTQASQPVLTGGLFGTSNQTSQPTQGGGLFGAPLGNNQNQNQNQNQTQNTTSGLFGASTQQKTNNGLFGSTLNNQQSTSALGPGLSMGQSTNQQTVPGVRIDVSNIRGTTRFNDLQEDLQKQIAELDRIIESYTKQKGELDAFMPAHGEMLHNIPNDVKFIQRKYEGVESALGSDKESINEVSELIKQDANHARLSFRAIDNLKLPQQYHVTGLWASRQQPSGSANAEADGQEIVGFFSKTADDMDQRLKQYEKNLSEIELHMHGIEGSLVEKLQKMMANKNGGPSPADEKLAELGATLRDFEEGILIVAQKVGGAREGMTRLQLGDFMANGIDRNGMY
ncbi:hypothetical protein BJ170DRAFT_221295 [Xylariales sp. AK1849]|nr:hypothetical protein BJ170DRAFT_221295 [Xylariales sp. AK1849]